MIRGVLLVLQSSKDLTVRQEGLEAVTSIASALQPELTQQRFLFLKNVNLELILRFFKIQNL